MTSHLTPSLPNDGEPRFEEITSPCEYVEAYRPGSYHPTHLGDVFNDGQYKIIRKLGEGSYSTVWLARDLRNHAYVALKILVSDIKQPISELQILHFLQQDESAARTRHVTQLLDEFHHQGPNGIHICLVFEPMGPSVNSMVEELPQFKPRRWGMNIRYPFWMAKSILKQSLQALAYLHDRGLAHGDFQPGNMLFCVENIDSVPEEELQQQIDPISGSTSPPVQRLDGKQDPWAPRYLCIAQPLSSFTKHDKGFRIKLSDMGGTYFFTNPPAKILTPTGLRAPELFLSGEVHKSLDMWAFGCLLFELVTGEPLFCVPGSRYEDDDHLLFLSALLGPLPDGLFKLWKNSSLYFTAERKLFNCQLGGVQEGEEPLMVEQTSMEEAFDRANPDTSKEEALCVKALVRQILQYDPDKRPSPKEVLSNPLFR